MNIASHVRAIFARPAKPRENESLHEEVDKFYRIVEEIRNAANAPQHK